MDPFDILNNFNDVAEEGFTDMDTETIWEYFVDKLPMCLEAEEIAAKLNIYGSEGWELVTITDSRYIFKRRTIPCYSCDCSESEANECPMYLKYIAGIGDNNTVTEIHSSCEGCEHAPDDTALITEFYCDKLKAIVNGDGCDLYEESNDG